MRALVAALFASCLFAPVLRATPNCPIIGDVAPGALDETSFPAVWRAQGDGVITVADVVSLLRSSVALQVVARPAFATDCPLDPSDLSPGFIDARTVPPTWRSVGNGRVDVADVVIALRAAVGMQKVERTNEQTLARLKTLDSCGDLERWIKNSALGALDHGGWSWRWWGGGPMVDATGSTVPTAGGAAPGNGAGSRSGTNTQEAGVDEADIVKTDGRWLYAISDGRVRVLEAWPAEQLSLVAEIDIHGAPQGLFLRGDQLIVISNAWEPPATVTNQLAQPFPTPSGVVKVSIFSVSDPRFPRLVREVLVDGWLSTSRVIGRHLVLVLYHALPGPPMPPWNEDHAAWLAAARGAIESSTLEDWMPHVVDVRPGSGLPPRRGFLLACERVRRPDQPDLPGLVSVSELDLDGDTAPAGAAIVGHAAAVYVSERSAFITQSWWSDGNAWNRGGERTRVHGFDLATTPGQPTYRGSGVVPGTVLDSFSLDEEGADVRVATSTWNASLGEPENQVSILQQRGDGLDFEMVGAVGGIAPGERLFSARFDGNRGYLVTFRRVDPLFTLDLSISSAPRVAGELEVTGFSSYLHPLTNGHLIGLGEEIDPDTQQPQGMQLSLFDVRNLETPLLRDREIIGTPGAGSEAMWDHHAFTFFEPQSTLAIPVVDAIVDPSTGVWQRTMNGLRLFRVTPEQGIARLGMLALPQDEAELQNPWCSQVRRSVFLDDVVIAVADSGVVAAPIADLTHPIGLVRFDRPECWCGCPPDGTVPPDGGNATGGAPGGAPGSGP